MIAPASGNVPYEATSESEFAVARFSSGTKCGHRRVLRRPPQQREDLDEERDDHQQPEAVDERQRRDAARPRPRSQHTITLRRSNRSTITPPSVARKKPGTMRTPDHEAERGRRAVRRPGRRARGSRRSRPSRPGSRTTCASQSLKNGRVPNSRHGAGGIECSSDEGGMNGAGSGLTHASAYGERLRHHGAAGSDQPARPRRDPLARRLFAVFLVAFFAAVFFVGFFFVAFFLAAFFFGLLLRPGPWPRARAAARPPPRASARGRVHARGGPSRSWCRR